MPGSPGPLVLVALVSACSASARPTPASPRPELLTLVNEAEVLAIGDDGDRWGKTVDARALGPAVDLYLLTALGTTDEVAFVVAGERRALRIPIARAPDEHSLNSPDGLLFHSVPRPHRYADLRDAFEGAPRFPTRAPVLASYRDHRRYEIAWVVTREADELVIWVATGPYEDVTTDGAAWQRLVVLALAPGAAVATPPTAASDVMSIEP